MVDKAQGMATLGFLSIVIVCAVVFEQASSEVTGECTATPCFSVQSL